MKLLCLDRHNNKHVALQTDKTKEDFSAGEFLIYDVPGDKKNQQSIAKYLGLEANKKIDRYGTFQKKLSDAQKEQFDKMDAIARKKFPLFKKKFKTAFPDTIPVTARFNILTGQYYFFFYGEDRYNFSQFVRDFRSELGQSFFLFQIGARDMVKMSPATDSIVGCNGKNLCCKSNRPLPSIDIEVLLVQHLEGRDIERLKGRCGKLKCSLMYEAELYFEENKKYPKRGEKVESNCGTCGSVMSFNVITGTMLVKDENNSYVTIELADVKKKYHESLKK